MKGPIDTPITGRECISDLTRPINALAEFYKAFNESDFALMEQNWLNTPEAAMSNPLGGLKRGWQEIRSVYQNIFNGPAEVYVEFFDYTIIEGRGNFHVDDEGYFQAIGRERGHFTLGDMTIELAIRTSRIFQLRDGRYQQLHHHGSIEDPRLLETYQKAVLTGTIE